MKLGAIHRANDHVRYLQRSNKVLPPPDVRPYQEYAIGEVEAALRIRIENALKGCEAYERFEAITVNPEDPRPSRNHFAECSNSTCNARTLFCVCCAFREPVTVMNILVNYFVRFYEPGYYNDIAVAHLLPADELESLDLRQSLVDFSSGLYPWRLMVDRHLSRCHWMAVNVELERMLNDWTAFISFVNGNINATQMKQKTMEYWQCRLFPARPPKPSAGYFLISKQDEKEMRKVLGQNITRFYLSLGLVPDLETTEGYNISDMAECWSLHHVGEPQSDVERLICRLIEAPERLRRQLNACRCYHEDDLDLVTKPCGWSHFTFAQDVDNDAWTPLPEEIEMCRSFLSSESYMKTWWIRLVEDTPIERRTTFVVEDYQLEAGLTRLVLNFSFDAECIVNVTWLPIEQDVDTSKAKFAVLIPTTAVDFAENLDCVRTVFHTKCAAREIIISQTPPEYGDVSHGCMLVFVRGPSKAAGWE